jgi:hypothetical protein
VKLPPYPLSWPFGWARTKAGHRKDGNFRVGFAQSRDELLTELRKMGVPRGQVVISSNLQTRRDGLPYARKQKVTDPGIAVYFSRRAVVGGKVAKKDYVIACDQYKSTAQNLRSIVKTIEAMRGIKRWGAISILERAFSGFEVLPPPPEEEKAAPSDVQVREDLERFHSAPNENDKDDPPRPRFPEGDTWWEVLGFSSKPKTLREAMGAYRVQVLVWHPDVGGSDVALARLNEAIAQARESYSAA